MLLAMPTVPSRAQAQTEPDHLFLFALFWQQSDVGPDQFDYRPADLLCTLAGLCTPSGPGGPMGNAEVVGRTFLDVNRDGVYGAEDEPLGGVPVSLYDLNGARVAATLSREFDLDGNGTIDPSTESGVYAFVGLVPGDYFVIEEPPLAFARTTQNASTTIEVDKTAQGVVAADLDGDMDDDLVVNRTGGSVGSQRGLTVLFNEGEGQFSPYKPSFGSSSDSNQTKPVVADFDLDGMPDLGVGAGNTYFTLSQTGSGSFISGGFGANLGSSISRLQTSDLNNDELPDVAGMFGVADQVFILRNLGLDAEDNWLGMSDPIIFDATDIESLAVGDIDGDGFPDIVTGTGLMFLNDGEGGFSPFLDESLRANSSSANDIDLIDVDGDSDLDVVLTNGGFKGDADFTVVVAENNGLSEFTAVQSFVSIRPFETEPIDLENDGDIDLATRINVGGDDLDADYIQYLINDGFGGFTLLTGPFVTGENTLTGLAAANLDGLPGDELVIVEGFTGFGNPEFIHILEDPLGRTAVQTIPDQRVEGPDFGNALSATVIEGQKFEDLNFNGVRDPGERGLNGVVIEAFNANFGMARKARGVTRAMDLNGDGSFDPESEHGRYRLVFEPDGRSENLVMEVIPNGFLQTLPNTPRPMAVQSVHEAFLPDEPFVIIQLGAFETSVLTAADLDGDGAPEFLYAGLFDPEGSGDPNRNVIHTLFNDGEGAFDDPVFEAPEGVAGVGQEFTTEGLVTGLAAGDFDGDGDQDFAALETNSGELLLFRGEGSRMFSENGVTDRGHSAGAGILLSGDLDNDQDIDLATVNSGSVSALLNQGDGTFILAGTMFGMGVLGAPNDAVLTDLNGDGFPDLAVSQNSALGDGAVVLLNLGVEAGNLWLGFDPGTRIPYEIDSFDPGPVAAGNIDADADVELIAGKADGEIVFLDNDGGGGFSIIDAVTTELQVVNDLGFLDYNRDGRIDLVAVGPEDGFGSEFENGRILRGDGQGGFTIADPFFAFLADQIQIADFNGDDILDIGFHTDLSQRIGYFEFLQPRYLIEADIGDRVGDVHFGNFPVPGR